MDETALEPREQTKLTKRINLIKHRVSDAEWVERIRDCQSSGLTVAEYCRRNGINYKTYYYHLRKLREQICSDMDGQIPVMIGELPSERSTSVTVRDGSGITIEIPDGTSREMIQALILSLKC